jgi:flavin reductase (DIM6/NTAB) family NADH-FMN oxidoreductase RutF/rubredoxin
MMKEMDTKALYDITYGLYVVSVKCGEKANGQIANTVFQLTSDPKTVGVCINKTNFTHECIKKGKRFGVSILAEDIPMEIIGLFGFRTGRDTDKFAGIKTLSAKGGSPILADFSIGYLECDLIREVDVGTHTLFIGALSDAMVLKKDNPMTYAYYHSVKKGTTPKTAPTYREPASNPPAVGDGMKGDLRRYRCPICGYIYDPAVGDAERGIEPGTPFEDLPSDWVCPICSVPKDSFIKE